MKTIRDIRLELCEKADIKYKGYRIYAHPCSGLFNHFFFYEGVDTWYVVESACRNLYNNLT
jgi:hypothetical protein